MPTGIFARLRAWLFDGGGPETLPERVRAAIVHQQERSEILIAWIQLAIIGLVATVYETTSMPGGVVAVRLFIRGPGLRGLWRLLHRALVLAYRRLLRPWMLYVSVVADMALLMGLIFSFPLKYAQPAAFYLKVPTLLYVFLFIALRALRFEARFVLFTGLTAIAGWIALRALCRERQGWARRRQDRRLRRVHGLRTPCWSMPRSTRSSPSC